MSTPKDWSETPGTALAFYLSLTFEQQCALAFVIDWQRRETRRTAAEMIERLKAEYVGSRFTYDTTPMISNAEGPHSRGCGIRTHEHGAECSRDCPTCGGPKPADPMPFRSGEDTP